MLIFLWSLTLLMKLLQKSPVFPLLIYFLVVTLDIVLCINVGCAQAVVCAKFSSVGVHHVAHFLDTYTDIQESTGA